MGDGGQGVRGGSREREEGGGVYVCVCCGLP